ncbi:MAG: hypothetical protein JW904_04820 [Spirochaetales bacterium]|nr:hypothetical protein [Spirochaetales bacterium]
MLKILPEILLVAGFPALLFITVDPFGLFMPHQLQMIMICVFAAAFGAYAGLP